MASKTTPSLNEANKNVKPSSPQLLLIVSTDKPSPSHKLKSAPQNANAKTFNKKNNITSEKKSSPSRHGFSCFNVERNQAVRDQIRESDIKNKLLERKRT